MFSTRQHRPLSLPEPEHEHLLQACKLRTYNECKNLFVQQTVEVL